MENLWSGGYPALETRPRRSTAGLLTKPYGVAEKDGLFWVDGNAMYANGVKTGLVLTEGDKQLVSMGAYLLVFPDKKYINTQRLTEFGSMENVRESEGTVTFSLCDGKGRALGSYSVGTEAPTEATAGELWLDTGLSVSVMRQYDGSTWAEMTDVCTRIAATGIGKGFAVGDGVTVAGCGTVELNGLHSIRAVGDNFLVVPALCRTLDSQTATVTVIRSIPDMDFVVEQGNRLWGCKYGIVNGQAVNEVYACALEQLCGLEHRQLCGGERLGRCVYRGGRLHGRRCVLQGGLHGAGVSRRRRRAPDRDGGMHRRAKGRGSHRRRGRRRGVLPGERRGVCL